jgi:DNA-binding response OmpR family regulator
MRILIAEDDALSQRLLEETLHDWGHEPLVVRTGLEAWNELRRIEGPPLAILDWVMPGMDGLEVCRRVQSEGRTPRPYLILLTAKGSKSDLVAGLASGADDYIPKPFDPGELQARINVGVRVLELQQRLADRVAEQESALAQIKRLQGLLPICMYCKKIRDDHNYWSEVETYLADHSEARFTHGICPDCYVTVMGKPSEPEV